MIRSLCVFCSSSDGVGEEFFSVARALGQAMAERQITLVYGGARVGLMGEVARASKSCGGRVIGIIPQSIFERGLAMEAVDELLVVETLRARKAMMEERSDGFIILPGGFGTLEEALEIITLRQLNTHQKPIMFINAREFFTPLFDYFELLIDKKFIKTKSQLFFEVDDVAKVWPLLDHYHPESIPSKWH